MNTVQLVGTQSGETLVPVYSWNTFLGDHFRKLPGIKRYHHFTLSARTPGVVTVKEYADSPSTTVRLLCDDWTPAADEMPPIILPSGLSAERQWYLFNQIREFCREGTKDLVCPHPTVPQLGEQDRQEQQEDDREESGDAPPAPKRARKCGLCGQPGHTRRTCKATT